MAIQFARTQYVSRTQITDDELVHLQNLTNLKVLSLDETQVSAEAKYQLRHFLPNFQ